MAKTSQLKDKRIAILYHTSGSDEYGQPYDEWKQIPNGQVWAYYRHASANEFYAAATVNHRLEVIFEIRWRDDVTVYNRILYKGEEYEISRVDDYEGYKESLRLYAFKID